MFSNLIESGSHAADLKRKGRFFLATTAFYGLLLAVTGVGSIYAYNAKLDYNPDYELISMMRFPPTEARSEEPRREEQRAASSPARNNQFATRTEISMQTPYHSERIASIDTPEVNPRQNVVIARFNSDPQATGGPVGPFNTNSLHGSGNNVGPAVTEAVEPPPPAVNPTPTPAPTRPEGPVRLTSTLISSKTLEKPAPPYPAIAKAANVQGTVAVQIVIDEQGHVTSAKATSGHPLLLNAAVQAAYRARFTPTVLGGQPVKVTGSIAYNFVLH
ncbi:MAG: periplasmic protein TonB [Acidobacteriota bacterium]|jgi:protein TonB|nr:periplasmic protein TonB [Acidobacteriota bacterium]